MDYTKLDECDICVCLAYKRVVLAYNVEDTKWNERIIERSVIGDALFHFGFWLVMVFTLSYSI